ncbi:MAG: zinc-dependent peptidase [Fuerstiella sp.]|nr:zinc-dependent peptidase [Fuerstiella sp.]
MLLKWLRRRRRRNLTAQPFPEEWNEIVRTNVFHDQRLSDGLRNQLRKLIRVFVAEKNWEGCNGFAVTDEVKVTIAAQACLLALGLQDVYFDHVLSILVYPDSYIAQTVETTRAGVVVERGHARLGEAWWRGPVILSWSDVLAGGRRVSPGRNLVFHEFAHQLDMMNGRMVDGTPPLETKEDLQRWVEVLEPEYKQLVERCRRGHQGVIDCYGTTNVAEFFAVVTEVFFERPQSLSSHHPHVYDELRGFFQLDPLSWQE